MQPRFCLAALSLLLPFAGLMGQSIDPHAKEMAPVQGGLYVPLYSGNSLQEVVKPFLIDRYPVTNTEFAEFVNENPEWGKTQVKRLFADENYLKHWTDNSRFANTLSRSPVVYVSWFAAQKYCECQGKRLATTAEWELVAEAGRTRPDGRNEEGFYRWILDKASEPTPASLPDVGKTLKNYYGVWDMHGLVWEWTYDFNSALTTGESRGNSSLDNTLFCGGGSFQSKDIGNYAAFLRFAMRSSLKAKYAVHNVGFRCAKVKDELKMTNAL